MLLYPRYESVVRCFVNDFGQRVLKNIPGNVVVSPTSAQSVLALTQLGAKGVTAKELRERLYLSETIGRVMNDFNALHSKLRTNHLYTLNCADKIYLNEDYFIKKNYIKIAKEYFNISLERVNFANEVKVTESINEWVRSQTNGRIRDLVKPGMTKLTRMVLVNAINFKAKWSLQFERFETCKRKFFKSDNETLNVDTMHQTGMYKYVENKELDAKILQIPYKGHDVSMTVALPNQKDGLEVIENRLDEVLFEQEYQPKGLSLFMPRFRIESSLVLTSVLQELGIREAFDSNKANFSELVRYDEQRLVINDIVQKAFIRVTETGTETPEGNGGGLRPYFIASEDPLEVRLDRPFFFAIKFGNIPLYLGRMTEPTY